MSLKPIAPKGARPKRVTRPVGAPVVLVQKKSSGSGGWLVLLLLLAAAGGGWFVYDNHQKNEAAIAAREHQLEENARRVAEVERQKAEYEASKKQKAADSHKTAMGTAAPVADTSSPATAEDDSYAENDTSDLASDDTPAPAARKSAMGSTEMEGGEFAEVDTTPPPYDLTAEGAAAKKVIEKLSKAIDAAGKDNTFHDLQADLKRSFDVAQPTLFTDATTLPPFPDKEHRLLRIAQGVYVCLTLAAELEAQNTVPEEKHAKFVNWLLKEKADAARTFSFGLEHYNITDVATATTLLDELRAAYIKTPTSAKKKIKPILEKGAK